MAKDILSLFAPELGLQRSVFLSCTLFAVLLYAKKTLPIKKN
jgi:hypothetical protein